VFGKEFLYFPLHLDCSNFVQGCLKKRFTALKASEDMYNILNCHNVAKHTKFYLGYLWFNVTADVVPVVSFFPHTMYHLCLQMSLNSELKLFPRLQK
jgi:hypothetical protein